MRITFSTEPLYTRSQIEYLLGDYCHICDLIKFAIERHPNPSDGLGIIKEIFHPLLRRHGKLDVTMRELLYSHFSNLCRFENGRDLVRSLEKMIESVKLRMMYPKQRLMKEDKMIITQIEEREKMKPKNQSL